MVFTRNMDPLDGLSGAGALRKIRDYIAYLQEAVEFSAAKERKELTALRTQAETLEKRIEQLEQRVQALERSGEGNG